MRNERKDYSDIIDLPHPTSKKHPRMPVEDRAAQFAAFSALTGLDDAIAETGRLTEAKVLLDEEEKGRLDEKLQEILADIDKCPEIVIEYFRVDEKKAGGVYQTFRGRVKKIHPYRREIWFLDGFVVRICDIKNIEMI